MTREPATRLVQSAFERLKHSRQRLLRLWSHVGGAVGAALAPSVRARARDAVAEVRALKAAGYKTLAYAVSFDYFIDVFEPVYRALAADDRIVIYVVYPGARPELRREIAARFDGVRIVDDQVLRFLPLDAFVSAEICPPSIPLSGGTRAIQMYHGTGVGFLSRFPSWLRVFDAHLAPGPQFVQFLALDRRSRRPGARIYEVGYPKTDALVTVAETGTTRRLRDQYLRAGMKTIVYAPHFSPFGSLRCLGEPLVAALVSTGARVLIKLHGYGVANPSRADRRLNLSARLDALTRTYPSVSLVPHANTQDLYALADVVVTDAMSSVAGESSLCRKPLVAYRLNEEDPLLGVRHVEADVERLAFVYETSAEAGRIVEQALNPDAGMRDRLAEQRRLQAEFVDRYLFHPGAATARAVEAIRVELNLPPQGPDGGGRPRGCSPGGV